MSDKLFKYFLVYDSDDIAADLKSTSATLLIQQIIGEQSFLLQQQGFDVSFKCDIEDEQIDTDAVLLKRVFDNIFQIFQNTVTWHSLLKLMFCAKNHSSKLW